MEYLTQSNVTLIITILVLLVIAVIIGRIFNLIWQVLGGLAVVAAVIFLAPKFGIHIPYLDKVPQTVISFVDSTIKALATLVGKLKN